MGAIAKPTLSPSEYLELERRSEGRHEYYAGELFAMAGGSPAHGLITMNIGGELRQQLKGRPCRVFSSDVRIRVIAADLYTYPDLSVVCGEVRHDELDPDSIVNPILIVEVLSPSTEAYDRGTKFHLYSQLESLSQYLLVAQDSHRIDLLTRQPDGSWRLTTHGGLEAVLPLTSIGCALTVVEVYDKVELEMPAPHIRPPVRPEPGPR